MPPFIPVPGDPTAYLDSAGNDAVPQHCPDGFFFDPDNRWCARSVTADAAVCIDNVSPGEDRAVIAGATTTGASVGDPATVVSLLDPYINVGITYQGSNLGALSVAVHVTSDRPNLAIGKSNWFATKTGNDDNVLTDDGLPHPITVFASTELLWGMISPFVGCSGLIVPILEMETKPKPLSVEPGQEVEVVANLFHAFDLGDQDEGHAPVLAATATRTVTVVSAFEYMPTEWIGTWSSGGTTMPAALTLSTFEPLTGAFVVRGMCTAAWTQTQRLSDSSRVVSAHVVSGEGQDNSWDVTIGPRSLTAHDMADSGSTVALTPAKTPMRAE